MGSVPDFLFGRTALTAMEWEVALRREKWWHGGEVKMFSREVKIGLEQKLKCVHSPEKGCHPSRAALPELQPLPTCGCWALGLWLLEVEMCCDCKVHSDLEDIVWVKECKLSYNFSYWLYVAEIVFWIVWIQEQYIIKIYFTCSFLPSKEKYSCW